MAKEEKKRTGGSRKDLTVDILVSNEYMLKEQESRITKNWEIIKEMVNAHFNQYS